MKQSKSRKSRENTAFLYERLSRDDNLDGDSYSIQNQEKMCQGGISPKGKIPPIKRAPKSMCKRE